MRTEIAVWLLLISGEGVAQSSGIRGKVQEDMSRAPIPFASVQLLDTLPLVAVICDEEGRFQFNGLAVGRYSIKASALGYEPAIVREVLVGGQMPAEVNLTLLPLAFQLGEAEVEAHSQRERPMNSMAAVSARPIRVEEARRYAGGFDDPARLATAFGGVSGGIGNNGLSIRGNAPKFVQWRMEGVEIPNPNHFADLGGFGGGGITALSTYMLANSDFFTGAFPAEYGNALSGVLDMSMRTGDLETRRFALQAGVIGLDASGEGPFGRKKNASYLFNYRYSTLGLLTPLLPEDAGGTSYQDLAFKFHFNQFAGGSLDLWGIGLSDRSGQTAETDSLLWIHEQDRQQQDAQQSMGAAGFRYARQLGAHMLMEWRLSGNGSRLKLDGQRMSDSLSLEPELAIGNHQFTAASGLTFSGRTQGELLSGSG